MSGPSFRFRLERVRALRERGEEAAKQSLAEAMHQQSRCRDEVDHAEAQVAQARTAQLRAAGQAPTGADLRFNQAFLERTERAAEASRRDLERHDREVERRRQALREAARERQALERLKEHRRADHDREAARQEGLVLDEIALTGFRRGAA